MSVPALQVGADWVQRGEVVIVSEVLTGFGWRGGRDLRRCWRASGSELPENTEVVRVRCSPPGWCRLPSGTRWRRSRGYCRIDAWLWLPPVLASMRFRGLRLESQQQRADQRFLLGDLSGVPEVVSLALPDC